MPSTKILCGLIQYNMSIHVILIVRLLEILLFHLVRAAIRGNPHIHARLGIGSDLDALALDRFTTEAVLALGLGHYFGAIRGIGVAFDGDLVDGLDGAGLAGGAERDDLIELVDGHVVAVGFVQDIAHAQLIWCGIGEARRCR